MRFIIGFFSIDLFDGVNRDSVGQMATADSSVIGIQMLGLDARYQVNKFQAKGELFFSNFSNTKEYNAFTDKDLGSSMFGFYAEVGYNINAILGIKKDLVPFVRWSEYNTHNTVNSELTANKSYDRTVLTTGISFFLNESFVVKADYQNFQDANNNQLHQFNSGIGFWFR